VDPHFIPNYNPWEQRFVLRQTVIFKAIRKGKAVVTDQIDRS
jgi:cation diffusion facilitator CzcD-associated flavoprotein CzcO